MKISASPLLYTLLERTLKGVSLKDLGLIRVTVLKEELKIAKGVIGSLPPPHIF